MKIVRTLISYPRVPVGVECDRCGTRVIDDPQHDRAPPPYYTVTVDGGREGELLRGDFCGPCHDALGQAPGGWRPHLRSIGSYSPRFQSRAYHYQVRDEAEGGPSTIDSILFEDDLM